MPSTPPKKKKNKKIKLFTFPSFVKVWKDYYGQKSY